VTEEEREEIRGKAIAAFDACMLEGGTVEEATKRANEVLSEFGFEFVIDGGDGRDGAVCPDFVREASVAIERHVQVAIETGDPDAPMAQEALVGIVDDYMNGDEDDARVVIPILALLRLAYEAGKAAQAKADIPVTNPN
jgi:hypothetical protein